MINHTLLILLDLLTIFAVLSGTFFMAVAALGLWRMPDLYHRMHAATKGVTLGIMGLLVAALLYLPAHHQVSLVQIATKIVLVILFQFIANPIGAHLLSKAAHLDRCPMWSRTLSDELDQSP